MALIVGNRHTPIIHYNDRPVSYELMTRRFYLMVIFVIITILFMLWWLWSQSQVVSQVARFGASPGGSASTSAPSEEAMDVEEYSDMLTQIDQNVWQKVLRQAEVPVGPFVRPPDQPTSFDVTGSYVNGFEITNNAVALGSDTTGEYVKKIVAGDGLQADASGEGSVAQLAIEAGDGVSVTTDGIELNLQVGGGLAFTSGAVGLSTACGDGEILKWNGFSNTWDCANDDAGAGSLTVRESDGAPSASASTLEFGPAASSDDEFIVSNQGAGVIRLRTGTKVPLTDADVSIAGDWTFVSEIAASGGVACSSCIALSSETIGDYLGSLAAGSGINVSGSGGENATPTVSLDSSLAIFKTIDASAGTDPVADSLTDTLALSSGSGVTVTGTAASDSVSFDLNLLSGGGLAFSGSALSLLTTCGDTQYLQWSTGGGSWGCASLGNLFQTVAADTSSAVADSTTDTVTLTGGNGVVTSANSGTDTVTLDVDLASGSGLAFSSGGLTLASCSDGQILKRSSGAWSCAADDDNSSVAAYKEQLSGADNITVGSSLTPLLTNGSGTAQNLSITITSGHEVAFSATIETSTTVSVGAVTYTVIRDDNNDNDCATGGGDGTQIGGQMTGYIGSITQNFTTSFSFSDSSPGATTVRYQLCASTPIALGTVSVTDRSLRLQEVNY